MMISKMIKNISVASLAIAMMNAAYSAGEGFYLGAQFGAAKLQGNAQTMTTTNDSFPTIRLMPKDNTFGSRTFIGSHFNQYAGIEAGLSLYAPTSYKSSGLSNNIRTTANSFDLLGKGIFPFEQSSFALFAKLGGAYLHASTSGSIAGTSVTSVRTSAFRPEAVVGFSYDLSQRWVTEVSYSRIFYKSTYISNPTFISLGISYHWVEEYCGQFLC